MSATPERLEAALDIALDALRLIADDPCERVAKPYARCSTGKAGYTRGARYDGWCTPCVAVDALARVVDGSIAEPPSWRAILTEQRDQAVAHAEAMQIVGGDMADRWAALRRAASSVLAVPEKTVDDVRALAAGGAS